MGHTASALIAGDGSGGGCLIMGVASFGMHSISRLKSMPLCVCNAEYSTHRAPQCYVYMSVVYMNVCMYSTCT